MVDGYDRDDMEMRNLAFEVARMTSMARSLLVKVEWTNLTKEDPEFATKYPGIAALVQSNMEFLDPNSFGNKLLFDNPLMKLAIISQAPDSGKEPETESEKSPG